jgi:DNA-binding NarL/FixJ family response regulator
MVLSPQSGHCLASGLKERNRRVMKQPLKNVSRPLGSVWINCPYSVVAMGLRQALEMQARVHLSREAPEEQPSCAILCTGDVEGLSESIKRVHRLNPGTPVLVCGLHLDLPLARAALQVGARGFIHAGMPPEQIVRAVEVAAKGELVAPRELLQLLLAHEDEGGLLSSRQQEILDFVVEGLSNAQIAQRLYLSESTVKQHLRSAYKVLGVSGRMEAARLMRNGG